ncbi:glycosyltransferase family 39 protein [Williamsia deligens]
MVATLVTAIGTWRPSLWYDEAATVSATDRPLPDMMGLLGHVDAVHTGYYLLMHLWLDATGSFGLTQFGLRLPSAVGVGVAAAGLTALGTRVGGRRFGITAAVVFVALPRIQWAGSEARPYALAVALTVLAALAAVIAGERGGAGRWILQWFLATLASSWFAIAILLLPVHVAWAWHAGGRRSVRPAIVSAVASACLSLPFLVLAHGQSGQISWIPPFGWRTLGDYVRDEFLMVDDTRLWSVMLGGVIAVLTVAAIVSAVASMRGGGERARSLAGVTAIGVFWVVGPAVVLLVYSALATPTYTPRYLAVTAPGLALVVAQGIRVLSQRWVLRAIVVLVLVGLSVPAYLHQREPYGRTGGTDFSQVAQHVRDNAHPGDCVAFQQTFSWSPQSQRIIATAEPDDFRGLRILAGSSRIRENALWDGEPDPTTYRAWMQTCRVVWVLADRDRTTSSRIRPDGGTYWYFEPNRFVDTPIHALAVSAGLHETSRTSFHNSQVVRMDR